MSASDRKLCVALVASMSDSIAQSAADTRMSALSVRAVNWQSVQTCTATCCAGTASTPQQYLVHITSTSFCLIVQVAPGFSPALPSIDQQMQTYTQRHGARYRLAGHGVWARTPLILSAANGSRQCPCRKASMWEMKRHITERSIGYGWLTRGCMEGILQPTAQAPNPSHARS